MLKQLLKAIGIKKSEDGKYLFNVNNIRGKKVLGDFYLDTNTENVYLKTAGTYSITTNIGGTNGINGLSITWLGTYNAGTTYKINDAVAYLGTSYIWINVTPASGHTPADDAYWDILALKGTDGSGSGDVNGPATNTDGYIPQWNGANSKILKDGLAVPAGGLAGLTALGGKADTAQTFYIGTTQVAINRASAALSLALDTGSLTLTGSIADTANRVLKGWFTNLEITNLPTINGGTLAAALGNYGGFLTSLSGAVLTTTNQSVAGIKTFSDATEASNTTTGGTIISGGLAIAKRVYALDMTVTNTITGTTSGNLVSGGALGTPSSGTLTSCTGLPIAGLTASTSTALGVGSVELGHATDTTIARVSAGVISVEGVTIPSISSTNTLTNKRITPRILSAASYTTDTGTSLNCDNLDEFIVTGQTGALKLNNPTGTPTDGQILFVAITGTAARALTYDTQFEASTTALPTTTVTTARLNMIFVWANERTKWVLLAAS